MGDIMSYLKNNLIKDEYIITKANLTNWIYFNEFIYLSLLFVYFSFLIIIVDITEIKSLFAIMPFLIIWLIFFITEIIKDFSTELVLTNKRVLGKKGFIKIDTLDTPYSSIDNLQIKISFLGRILRYGTIIIESKSDSHVYKLVANPSKLKKRISSQILKNKT